MMTAITRRWTLCIGTMVMSNDKTKAASRALNDHLGALSFQENDRVFTLVGSLCAEHEQIAFLAGLQLGAQLMLEIQDDNDTAV